MKNGGAKKLRRRKTFKCQKRIISENVDGKAKGGGERGTLEMTGRIYYVICKYI